MLGQLQVSVRYNEQEQQLPLLVVAGDGPSLWGRDFFFFFSFFFMKTKLCNAPVLQENSYADS